MKIIKTASGKKLRISKTEWQNIGKKSGWSKVASTNEKYVIDRDPKTKKITLYYGDIGAPNEGDEVFDMKMLLKTFDVFQKLKIKELPEYKNASEWNKFLEILEGTSGIEFGRVEDREEETQEIKKKFRGNVLPDTRKQKKQEEMARYERLRELQNKGITDPKGIEDNSAPIQKNENFLPNPNDPRDVRRYM